MVEKWLIQKQQQTNEYNNASNVGYGKYGSVSLGGIIFLTITRFQVMLKNWRRKYERPGC
jgi:hypothetical protein